MTDSSYSHWTLRWNDLRKACAQHNATGRWMEGRSQPPRFHVGPPASESAVKLVEDSLRLRLPDSFRDVILTYSADVDIAWQLRDKENLPKESRQIFAGECRWSLYDLERLATVHQSWRDKVFSNPTDDYDAVWWNKLPFLEVGNGDMVAIDISASTDECVVYLSHDDGEGHGYHLGSNFADYVERLSLLGCPGAEDWQWLPFVEGPESLLLPTNANALAWRQWLGLR